MSAISTTRQAVVVNRKNAPLPALTGGVGQAGYRAPACDQLLAVTQSGQGVVPDDILVLGVMEVVSAFGIRSDAKKVEKATTGVRTPRRHCA